MGKLVLAIETSNPSAGAGDDTHGRFGPGVALARADGTIISERFLEADVRADDQLMPAIDAMCRDEGVTPRELGSVAISAGPGGLTGLRVAAAAGQMIAEAVGARVAPVPTAAVARAGLVESGEVTSNDAVLVALASRGEDTHISLVGPPDEPGPAWGIRRVVGMVPTAELSSAWTAGLDGETTSKVLVGDAFLPDAVREWAASAGVRVVPPRFSARAVARVAVGSGPGVWSDDAGTLLPIYPREPEAVRAWRARHGAAGKTGGRSGGPTGSGDGSS